MKKLLSCQNIISHQDPTADSSQILHMNGKSQRDATVLSVIFFYMIIFVLSQIIATGNLVPFFVCVRNTGCIYCKVSLCFTLARIQVEFRDEMGEVSVIQKYFGSVGIRGINMSSYEGPVALFVAIEMQLICVVDKQNQLLLNCIAYPLISQTWCVVFAWSIFLVAGWPRRWLQ